MRCQGRQVPWRSRLGARAAERVMGTALMSLLSYGHFSIGHVAGHHRLVGPRAKIALATLLFGIA